MAQTVKPDDTRPTCSETLGSFAANLRYEALPAAAIERVSQRQGAEDTVASINHVATADRGGPHTAVEMEGRKS